VESSGAVAGADMADSGAKGGRSQGAAGFACCPLYLRDSPQRPRLALRFASFGGWPAPAARPSLSSKERRHRCGRLSVLLPERSAGACAFGGAAHASGRSAGRSLL